MQQHDFLSALALVLCVAAVTTVLFQRLHQPVVLGYVLAGMLVDPTCRCRSTPTATPSTRCPSWA